MGLAQLVYHLVLQEEGLVQMLELNHLATVVQVVFLQD
jgi:hypothetical protein